MAPEPVDLIEAAVTLGLLIELDTILDDEPDSPTEGQFFKLFRSTTPETY